MKLKYIERISAIVAALIFIQTLFYKFTGAPESIYIFSKLGMEPFGRFGAGIMELLVAIMLLIPRTSLMGAILGVGIMIGAILSHLFVIGIEVHNDNGLLFTLAIITLISCLIVIFVRRAELMTLFKFQNLFNGRN